MKKILGLDLGTNSIGWAVVSQAKNEEGKEITHKILDAGSRIIPMDMAAMSDFESGNLKSQAAERTRLRSVRRLNERRILRRERLHRVLNVLGFLPPHYAQQIDFNSRLGQFFDDKEPQIAYEINPQTNKHEFIFMNSFEDMLKEFAIHQPLLKRVPHNWTLYYLRKKALTQKILKEELAWLLLHFNQKRGYYQQRGEEEDINQTKEYDILTVLRVTDTGEGKNGNIWYEVQLSDGGVYKRQSKIPLDWEGKTKEFIITHKVDKKGNETRSYSIPSREEDWTLIKKRTEKQIEESKLSVGTFIYDALLNNPKVKIKGELVQTIERKYYKEELKAILEKQKEFHPELQNQDLYKKCIEELYRKNTAYRNSIADRDFTYLFVQDIIFYHRPLKSKKSEIGHCPYEKRFYKVPPKTGNRIEKGIQCIHRTHPLFEEFRLWQLIQNIKLFDILENDITNQHITNEEDKVKLFEQLRERKEINQKSFLRLFKLKEGDARWNYGDSTLPLCPTRYDILYRLKKSGTTSTLSKNQMNHLWHILYSVTDKKELDSALSKFASEYELNNSEAVVEELRKIKPFESNYGAYSEKAIKKLLALMRMGKYWSEEIIDDKTIDRINKIIDGVEDETINDRTRENLANFRSLSEFRGLKLHQACYAVYGRHSETEDSTQWTSPNDIDQYLEGFKQHSLRNPVVEQVLTETLRTVRDIWKKHGNFSEIHLELGREMKSNKEQRVRITNQNRENELTNTRIRELLRELHETDKSVRPESPAQQERLKLYEEGVLGSFNDIPDDIQKIRNQREPSRSEITRYKCWLEQGYRSPYTGEIIPLNRLFSRDYEIEHIIPQARYFDDSLSNKVICESSINKDKGNQLAYQYITNNKNKSFTINGSKVSLLSPESYEDFVKHNFKNSAVKRKKLMLEDIPDSFIERQLNDTRYISKVVRNILSNIVREDEEQEAISKNIITVTGAITSKLKEDWGINDVWNNLVKDRFIRLNEIRGSNEFGEWIDNKFRTTVPDEFSRGYSKKRLDHRHHAMDAIVIACATRNHINYLNNESAREKKADTRMDLRKLLCGEKRNNGKWILEKPYSNFTQDVEHQLKNIVVSIKKNTRIITKATNRYQKIVDGVKKEIKQTKGDNRAIRKPLHKDTVFGLVNLQLKKTVTLSKALEDYQNIVDKDLRKQVKELMATNYDKKQILAHFKALKNQFNGRDISKVEVFYFSNDEEKTQIVAVRKPLDESFNKKKIETITDSGIREILYKHLENYKDKPEEAFSPDGLDILNNKPGYMESLNNGKAHQPIKRVRISEIKGTKYNMGVRGNKKEKYVEAAKGTNLFFAIYESENNKRSYESIPFNMAVENWKSGLPIAPEINEKGEKLLFVLSPNDFVYLPTPDQIESGNIDIEDINKNKDRIYKMVSCTGNRSFFIPYFISAPIASPLELGPNNKAERAWSGNMIKDTCISIQINRLGEISM